MCTLHNLDDVVVMAGQLQNDPNYYNNELSLKI